MASRSPCTTRCALIAAGPDRAAEEALGPGLHEAGPLLQQRLLEVLAGNADLPAELDDLVGGEAFADLPLGGLKLSGALDDALERGPVDASRKAVRHATPAACRERRRSSAATSAWRARRR